MADRKATMLRNINLKKDVGLEIGPLCWPLITKQEASVKYVDHVSTAELKKIYEDEKGVALDDIVAVDYSLYGRSLKETVAKDGPFDYIIASHVIEHVPDMVRWFQELASVLKVGGIVSLAIPDKRYTFDIDRQPSTPGDVVGAYLDTHTRAPSAAIFDFASQYRMHIAAEKAWEGELYLSSKTPHRYSLHQAVELCEESKHHYVDNHCFVLTPYSLCEILRTLIELDLLDFKVASFTPTEYGQYEFLVSLQKVTKKTTERERLQSLPELPHESYRRELDARIKQLESSNQNLEQVLDAQRDELRHILQSKSWRLTRPIRYGLRLAKKARQR